MQRLVASLTLFSSFGTLICCALPALLVSLGLGAAVASTASSIPQLVWLSENKIFVFIGAGMLLVLSGLLHWRTRNAPCPMDPELRKICTMGRRVSGVIFWISVFFYLIGGFFAYVAPILIS